MFQLSLTTYGQSLVSSSIQIDGIALTASYTSTISSLENVSSLTTVFDDDSVGNYNGSILNIRIRDLSSAAYQAKTIVFYKLVNSVKKIVAAYSNNSAIVNKTASSEVNLFLSFDASCFTHGFTLSSIQASPSSASLNNDGIVHIEDESTSADDSYSVYSKPQVDSLLENKQDSLSAGDGIAITNDVVRTTGIPFGICDNTSTATVFTVTVPGIYKLEDGVCCLVKNGVITSAAGFTLDVNGLGGKPVYSNMAAATAESTIFNINYTLLFVYDSTRVSGGCWICYRGYYSDKNDNSIGYQLRGNVHTLPTTAKFYRYRLLFTSADGTHFVPSNTSTSTNATSKRDVIQTPIDPFGEIVYYSTTTAIEANANPGPTYLWTQYAVTLGYSFNRTGTTLVLDSFKPLYIKCAPQSNGSAIIDADNPYVQTLPNTADGKIYIFLGITSSATTVELLNNHQVYYHDGTSIKVWVGKDSYSKTETDTLLASYVPTSRKVNNKVLTSDITLNLDDVADGSTRKLSDYVPTTRTVNSKALSSNITLTASDVGALPSSTTIPTVNDKTITIKKTSSDTGDTFTLNQSTDKTITLGLAAVATSGSYSDLSNKPTIPTVNNASLTINKGGTNDTTSKTFTANASSNVTINLGLGEAADKAVDSSISAASTSTKLPTSQAVASFVEGKGYITQHQSLSDLVATAQYNSTTGKIEFYNKSNTKLSTDIDVTPFTKDGMLDSVSVVTVGQLTPPLYGDTEGVVLVSYLSGYSISTMKAVRDGLGIEIGAAKRLVEQELPAFIYTGDSSQDVYNAILASSSYNSSLMTFYLNVATIEEVKCLRFHFNSDANKSDIDIPLEDLSQVLEDKLKTVAFTGSYNDLTNKPNIPSVDYACNKASGVIAGTGNIYGYQLVFRVGDNLYESICTSYTVDTTKTKNPHGFYLDRILYYNYSLTKNSGEIALSTYIYTSYPSLNGRYSFNCLNNSLTNNQAIYLVVTFNSTDRKFYLDDIWWTQTLPSTEDNKFYVYLGMVTNTSYSTIFLETDHPIFFFKNGKIRQTSAEIIDTVADMYVTTDTTQTITGVKTFSGATNFTSSIGFGTYHTNASTTVNTQLNVWDDTSNYAGGIDVTGNLNPAANETYDLGSTNYYWNNVNAKAFIKHNGTSSQFLKADGSTDSNTYVTTNTNQTITSSKTISPGYYLNFDNASIAYFDDYSSSNALQIASDGYIYIAGDFGGPGLVVGDSECWTPAINFGNWDNDHEGNPDSFKIWQSSSSYTYDSTGSSGQSYFDVEGKNLNVHIENAVQSLSDYAGEEDYNSIVFNQYIENCCKATFNEVGVIKIRSRVAGNDTYTDYKGTNLHPMFISTPTIALGTLHNISEDSIKIEYALDPKIAISVVNNGVKDFLALKLVKDNIDTSNDHDGNLMCEDILCKRVGRGASPVTSVLANNIYAKNFDIPYGECSTAAGTQIKEVKLTTNSNIYIDALTAGMIILVKFTYSNTAGSPALRIRKSDDTVVVGYKFIRRVENTGVGKDSIHSWNAGETVMLRYDGTYWVIINHTADLDCLYGTSAGAIYFFKLNITNKSSSTSYTVPRGTSLSSSSYFTTSTSATSLLYINSYEERVDDTSVSSGTSTSISGTYYTMLRFTVAAGATANVYVPCLRMS